MANPTAPGFAARRATAEAAVLAKVTESLAVAGKTPSFAFPTKHQIREDPVGAYTKLLEAIVTDLGYVDAELDTDATGVAAQTALKEAALADKAQLTEDKATLQAAVDANAVTLAAKNVTIDNTLTAILAGLEAAVLIVIAAMGNVAALTKMGEIEAAGANRAAVNAAIAARIVALS